MRRVKPIEPDRDPRTVMPIRDPRRRAIALAACALAGLGIGLLGRHLGGGDVWFLALPGAIAAGWLFVANPLRCAPPRIGGGGEGGGGAGSPGP